MPFRLSALLRLSLVLGLLVGTARIGVAQQHERESRTVGSFTEVEFGVPGTLHVRQGEPQSVEIEAPQKVLDRVETTVENGGLEIKAEGNFLSNWFGSNLDSDEMDVYVTAPTIEALSIAGSGRIVGETPIRSESLTVGVAGSGDLDMEVDAGRLNVEVAGSGNVLLRGRADAMDTNIAGSGDVRAADLKTRTLEVRIAGSGDLELHVTEHIDAAIFGSGDIRYRGNPSIELSSFGSGEVSPIE